MKKTFLTVFLVSYCCIAFAQIDKKEIELIQAEFGKEKRAMITEFIKLEGVQKDAFWKVYDEYEIKRKDLGMKRVELIERYATSYSTLDDATTDKLIKDMIGMQGQTDNLIATYYDTMKKAAGTKTAAQFYQFENYILSKLRGAIMDEIPFIGELEKKKK